MTTDTAPKPRRKRRVRPDQISFALQIPVDLLGQARAAGPAFQRGNLSQTLRDALRLGVKPHIQRIRNRAGVPLRGTTLVFDQNDMDRLQALASQYDCTERDVVRGLLRALLEGMP